MQSIYKINKKEDLYKCGIYKITCKSNNKIYIGSASAINKRPSKSGFYCRWKDHIRKLKSNKHRNKHLQNAWNIYGYNDFIFEILEICNRNEIIQKELAYILKNDCTNHEKGFNMFKGSLVNYNSVTEEEKQLSSKRFLGVPRPLHIVKKYSNEVIQLDCNKQIVAKYYSISEASRKTGIMRQDIGQACIGKKIKKAGGFYWVKVKDIV